MFTKDFDSYVVIGEHIDCEVDGFMVRATLHFDSDTVAPDDCPERDAWLKDDWHYYGVVLTVRKCGVTLTEKYHHALWGIEGNYPGGDNSYFRMVANELLPEALEAARKKIQELCK